MDKIWVKDVKEGERVKSVFLVARKAVPTAKSGKTYLAVTLQDRTGELEARAFERVDELAAAFDEKEHVEVEGLVGTFQGKPQLRLCRRPSRRSPRRRLPPRRRTPRGRSCSRSWTRWWIPT
jgi:3'-5' exoribonuclease